jgi:hypothetical protein
MARATCKFIVHFSISSCTTRPSFRKDETLLFRRPQPLSTSQPNTPFSKQSGFPLPWRNSFTTLDYGSSSSFWRVVWLTSSSRVDSAMRGSSISFLTRASVAWLDSCLGSFLCILHDVTSPKGLQVNLGQDCQVSALSSYRAVLNSQDQSAKRSISSVKQRAAWSSDRRLCDILCLQRGSSSMVE